ncbi:MAG: hypothetical protein ABGY75_06910 [Gemmataceae bacterium]
MSEPQLPSPKQRLLQVIFLMAVMVGLFVGINLIGETPYAAPLIPIGIFAICGVWMLWLRSDKLARRVGMRRDQARRVRPNPLDRRIAETIGGIIGGIVVSAVLTKAFCQPGVIFGMSNVLFAALVGGLLGAVTAWTRSSWFVIWW